jgi:hypothetical protein
MRLEAAFRRGRIGVLKKQAVAREQILPAGPACSCKAQASSEMHSGRLRQQSPRIAKDQNTAVKRS